MAVMIPNSIDRTDPRRQGEYMVYDWLSSADIPGVAFYSMPQTTHEVKTMSEVDFLYISERGMLCIEVKGGQEIYRKGKVWYSRNKKGEENKIADPFWQSHGCMKALQTYLENVYGEKSIESKFSVGCAVIFPECIAKCEGDGVIPEIMFDARYELDSFNEFLGNSIKYWTDKLYSKQGKRTIGLSKEHINQMVTLLEANFGSVPSMKLQISTAYNQMLQLTEEQFDIMESIADNRKVIVQGVAGTGKSVLAIEKARKFACMHKKVLYLCFNRNMSIYAKESIRFEENIDVYTFHALINQYIDDDTHSMNVEDISNLFLEKVKDNALEIYDAIIVDEAQDVMNISAILCIDKLLRGGLKDGNWIFFLDPNQNIFGSDEQYGEAADYLKGFNPCLFTLTYNCRNTAQIARNTSVLTTTNMTKYMKLSGPKVIAKHYNSVSEIVELLDKEIRSLLMGGTPVKDIVILSPFRKENSMLVNIDKLAGVDIVEVSDYRKKKDFNLNYYTVQAYKGLESQVVFYIDINGFQDMKNRRINYVAMSRAEIVLHLYYPESLEAEYKDMMIKGIDILEK